MKKHFMPSRKSNDVVIAVMGPTGSGKSHATGTGLAGSSLKSVTASVKDINIKIPTPSGGYINICLVDTPGFDDTHVSDTETLRIIAEWMEKRYRNKVVLSGILYLHRITDNRMAGTPLRNLRMFGKLCGGETEVGQKIVFVTTNWDRLRDNVKGPKRDEELQRYWQPMIDRGARSARFDNQKATAEKIILDVLGHKSNDAAPVLLQQEMVDDNLPLNETEAAQTLYSQFQTLLTQHKTTLQDLERAAQKSDDPTMLADLEAERARIQAELNKTFEDAKGLKVGKLRRIARLFKRRGGGINLGSPSTS